MSILSGYVQRSHKVVRQIFVLVLHSCTLNLKINSDFEVKVLTPGFNLRAFTFASDESCWNRSLFYLQSCRLRGQKVIGQIKSYIQKFKGKIRQKSTTQTSADSTAPCDAMSGLYCSHPPFLRAFRAFCLQTDPKIMKHLNGGQMKSSLVAWARNKLYCVLKKRKR